MLELREVCHLITDGKHGDCRNEEGSGFFFISCKDVQDGWIDYSMARQIAELDFSETHKRTQLSAGDIVITNSGTIGRMALVREATETSRTTFQKSVAIVKPNTELVDPYWLYYFLLANRNELVSWAGGTAQKNLLLRDLRAFGVELVPRPVQRKISTILSAYDELIENNNRRIKILEEMAQMLYREWFVEFRFPGHEQVKMVESDLGLIPEVWRIGKLSDLVANVKDNVKAQEAQDNYRYYAPIDCIARKSLALLEAKPITEAQSSLVRFESSDILFGAMRAYFHKVCIAPFPGITRSTCFVLRALAAQYYSFSVLMTFADRTVGYASQHSSGSTIPYAVWEGGLADMPVVVPPASLASQFEDIVNPMLERVTLMFYVQQNLRRTRDLLLPKLISGELDVSELDIDVGDE